MSAVKILFLCSRNRWRSPTAERVVASWPGCATRSAGLSASARVKVTEGDLGWADLVLVMERRHIAQVRRKYPEAARRTRIACLDIPDRYQLMDPALVALIEERVPGHLVPPDGS